MPVNWRVWRGRAGSSVKPRAAFPVYAAAHSHTGDGEACSMERMDVCGQFREAPNVSRLAYVSRLADHIEPKSWRIQPQRPLSVKPNSVSQASNVVLSVNGRQTNPAAISPMFAIALSNSG